MTTLESTHPTTEAPMMQISEELSLVVEPMMGRMIEEDVKLYDLEFELGFEGQAGARYTQLRLTRDPQLLAFALGVKEFKAEDGAVVKFYVGPAKERSA